MRPFQADVIHVTGPGHLGLLGAILAKRLGIPLVASWHTNVHEFAARRLARVLENFPAAVRDTAASFAEKRALDLAVRFTGLRTDLRAESGLGYIPQGLQRADWQRAVWKSGCPFSLL